MGFLMGFFYKFLWF